jgi:hypothetical protein
VGAPSRSTSMRCRSPLHRTRAGQTAGLGAPARTPAGNKAAVASPTSSRASSAPSGRPAPRSATALPRRAPRQRDRCASHPAAAVSVRDDGDPVLAPSRYGRWNRAVDARDAGVVRRAIHAGGKITMSIPAAGVLPIAAPSGLPGGASAAVPIQGSRHLARQRLHLPAVELRPGRFRLRRGGALRRSAPLVDERYVAAAVRAARRAKSAGSLLTVDAQAVQAATAASTIGR